MKAILEFDLNEPDDVEAHKRAVKALDLVIALWDIDQYLRSSLKYSSDGLTEDQYKVLDETREKFHDILRDRNISFDELLN
jgi:hypothetical protein